MNYGYNYDRTGRLTSIDQQTMGSGNAFRARIDSLQYDELGRVSLKLLNQNAYPINYSYTIDGKIKEISSPLFTQTLSYQDGSTRKYYNGNIAEINENLKVKHGNGNSIYTDRFSYGFTYDAVNRLERANIQAAVRPVNNHYDAYYSYDRNGNITSLNRGGTVQTWYEGQPSSQTYNEEVDELYPIYSGNQLTRIGDYATVNESYWTPAGETDFREKRPFPANSAPHYLYDKNGNLKADHHKNIAWVQYNSLNLPSKIQMGNGDKTEYLYDASGVKRRAKYTIALNSMQISLGDEATENTGNILSVNTRDYVGEYIFKNGVIERILMPDGYIESTGSNPNFWKRVYQIKDHVGNVRVEIETEKLNGGPSAYTLRSSSTYYPFGMEMSFFDVKNSTQPYQVSGNELERTNTNWHDFHHRWYDQQLGRFLSPDPLAELDYSMSPYAYCNNNPINMVDPLGLQAKDKDKNKDKNKDAVDMGAGSAPVTIYYSGGGSSWGAYSTLTFGAGMDGQAMGERMCQIQEEQARFMREFQATLRSQKISFGDLSVNNTTPFQVGVEWLTGEGPRERTFFNDDLFTKMLKRHEFIKQSRYYIVKGILEGQKDGYRHYGLDGFQGVWKYIKDYSTLLTLGKTGNLAVTYLGSYDLYWKLSEIDRGNHVAIVDFRVENYSTIQSALRPPVLGYTPLWQNTVGAWLNDTFSSGPMSTTKQTFIWWERLTW